MKVLLDEQLPVKLKYRLQPELKASTVRDEQWLGIENGRLIQLTISESFIVFITNDKSLYYQQKMAEQVLFFINLNQPSNRYEDILPSVLRVKEWLVMNRELIPSLIATKNYFIYPDDFV